MNPFQFKIPARKRKCLQCLTSFEDNTEIYSVIKGDDEEPLREDYCKKCFESHPEVLHDSWGFWESILKKPKLNLSLDQRAMVLFVEKHQEGEKEWVYFLAHYLKRKKQLILRSEVKKEGLLFFEDPITTEVYTVAQIELTPKMLSTLKSSFISALDPPEDS